MKRRGYKALLALGTLILAWFSPAAALEIVYPADKTYVLRSDFLIIKGGDQPALDGMTVSINGAKSELIDISADDYRAAFGDFLILEPEFDPGGNQVEVDGYADGKKVASAKADIYYLDGDPTAIAPSGYDPFIMHLPEKEKLCAPCHNMNPDKAQIAAEDAATNPCASCHRRMLNEKHVHGPAGVWRCAYCHDAVSKPNKYQARDASARLCNECHLEKVQKYNASKFVHGPVGAGLCLTCHDVHASAHEAQLLAAVNDVCLGCHETVGKSLHVVRGVGGAGHPLGGVPDPIRPGRLLSCASCHDPHGGQARAFFRRDITSRFALCQLCHQK